METGGVGGGSESGNECYSQTNLGAEKTMTATDATGFDAIFSTGFFATFSRFWGARLTKLHREPGEKAKNPVESLQWRRRPETADFCPLSWSNVSWKSSWFASRGPEMAVPILWAPGIFCLFLLENPHAHKIPPFRGGGSGCSLKGEVEVPILFLWLCGDFLMLSPDIPELRSSVRVRFQTYRTVLWSDLQEADEDLAASIHQWKRMHCCMHH